MMTQQNQSAPGGSRGRQIRRRLGRCLSGKSGKAIGFTSIAAPIAAFVINDLKKPDSVIKQLVGAAVKMLPSRTKNAQQLDISDQAEIIEHE